MKKVLALVIALALVLSMTTMVAFASEITPQTDRTTENDGKITVTGTLKGTYTLYKLFDADTGANDAITYTLPAGKTVADLTYTDAQGGTHTWFKLNSAGFIEAETELTTDWAKDPNAIAWAKSFGTKVGNSVEAASDGATVEFSGLAYGYYFVDTTSGSFIGVDSAKTVNIAEKNSVPGIDKEIVSTTSGVVGDDPAQATATDGDKGKNEAATAQVGDTVTYKITVTAQPGAENYVVTDTLSTGLTPPAAADVTVTGLNVNTDYTVSVNGQVITVTFTKAYLDTITVATDIVINYTAVLNDKAVVGEAGNPNTVKLEYGHDPDDSSKPGQETPPDEATVYTAKISVVKNDGNNTGLAGAEFALKNANGKYYKYTAATGTDPAKVEWVDAVADATKFTSDADGKLSGDFTGLPNGRYTLEETVTPEGYNPVNPDDASLKFTITGNDYTNDNLIQSSTVVNNAGSVLPSTGGIGTTIFYVGGGILVLLAVVLLVTKKRMSTAK